MTIKKINIEIESNHALIKTYDENNTCKTKLIDVANLQSIFKDKTEFDTGDLPVAGSNIIGIRRIYTRGNKGFIIANGVNLVRSLTFGSRHDGEDQIKRYDDIGLPSLLLTLTYEKDTDGNMRILNSYLHAHENFLVGDSDRLYVPPFGNIYADQRCRICWSSAGINQITHPGQVIGLVEMFCSSRFNGDLYSDGYADSSRFDTDSLPYFLRDLSRKSPRVFPYEEVKMRDATTYEGHINYLKENL